MNRLWQWLEPVSSLLAQRLKLAERLNTGRWNLHHKLSVLYGDEPDRNSSLRFASRLVSAALLGIAASAAGTAASGGDPYVAVLGLMLACSLPLMMLARLDREYGARIRSIQFELPELLNKLTLLVNAGETVQGAILRCAAGYDGSSMKEPLPAELMKLANRLRNNEPFPEAMEIFSRRCAVAEISVFTTTVLMNYRRGGDYFVLSLRSLNRELWEKRKAMTRTLGEEASSKLVFPMLLIFIAVMAIVAAPAVMLLD